MKFLLLISLIVLSGWNTAAKAVELAKNKLVLTGSSTVAPLALELAKRFEKLHPGVRIDVQSGGSSRGISDARQGLADIGLVSRALRSDESDLSSHTIAMDGVAVILHRSNPVLTLSKDQLLQIYSGKIKNWQEVGGKQGPIVVVNKAAGRSTLELFAAYLKIKESAIKADIIIGENEQGIKTVLGNPQAIAYVSIGAAEFQVKQGAALKILPLDGVEATGANVKKGIFPLSRPLNYVLKGPAQGIAKDFIAFSLSAEADEIIKEQYFVPVSAK